MKKRFTLLIAAFIAAFFITTTAHADSQSSPDTAAYISPLPQTIPANSAQWYKFDYAGDKSQVTIIMPNGTDTLVEFNVFTPEQAQTWWDRDTKPIGRGTAYTIDCETGEEVPFGECKSQDLKWVGQFNFPGTFFVQVINYNTGTANFSLNISGTGVYVAPPPLPVTSPVAPPPAVVIPVTPPQTPPLLPTTGGVWPDFPDQQPAPNQRPRE